MNIMHNRLLNKHDTDTFTRFKSQYYARQISYRNKHGTDSFVRFKSHLIRVCLA